MSEQFLFGPEHVGRRVRHVDGKTGTIIKFTPGGGAYAVIVDWGTTTSSYTSVGSFVEGDPVVVFINDTQAAEQPVITPSSQPDPAPETDYEETPFIPNRAEVWARFMAALIAGETVTSAANIADQALAEYDKRFLNQ